MCHDELMMSDRHRKMDKEAEIDIDRQKTRPIAGQTDK